MNKFSRKILSCSLILMLFSSGFIFDQKSLANPVNLNKIFSSSRADLLSTLPTSLHSCVDSQVLGGKLWSSVASNQSSYYLITLFLSTSRVKTVIEVDSSGCTIKIPFDEAGRFPLSNYLPQQIAYQLVLERYRHLIQEVGGQEAFQKILVAQEDPSSVTFVFPEAVWAYQQLGLQFPRPDSVVVVGSERIPSFSEQ